MWQDFTDARLSLGTVQFGMRYGIANADIEMSDAAIGAVLQSARDMDVKVIDTAAQYGMSEARLGSQDLSDFEVFTKTVAVSGLSSSEAARAIGEGARASAKRLGIGMLGGLLIHNAADLLGSAGKALYTKLTELRQSGCTAKIGVSIYEPAEVDEIFSRFDLDVVQLPVNVLDQRLLIGGHITALARRGVEVHARSAYLQGLLLMKEEALPPQMAPYKPTLARWRAAAADQGMTPREAALSFVRDLPGVRFVVVGAVSAAQFTETANAFKQRRRFDATGLACHDTHLVDPRRWATGRVLV